MRNREAIGKPSVALHRREVSYGNEEELKYPWITKDQSDQSLPIKGSKGDVPRVVGVVRLEPVSSYKTRGSSATPTTTTSLWRGLVRRVCCECRRRIDSKVRLGSSSERLSGLSTLCPGVTRTGGVERSQMNTLERGWTLSPLPCSRFRERFYLNTV